MTHNQVQDKLNAIMNMLFNTQQNKKISNSSNSAIQKANDNPMLIPEVVKETADFKALRRKRLAGWIHESDGTDLRLFYGEVKMSVQEKLLENKSFPYYLLKLRTKNKNGEWKYRASIYRGGIKDDINENKVYQIALIGNLDFKSKWLRIGLINQKAIRYKEI